MGVAEGESGLASRHEGAPGTSQEIRPPMPAPLPFRAPALARPQRPPAPAAGAASTAAAPDHAHAHVLVAGLDQPLVAGNRVDLLQDGPGTYAAMFAAIEGARDHVNLESYILEAEGPGAEFARRLVDKARAGVRVNVLYDSLGSIATPARYFDELRAGGVSVCEYNPLRRLGTLFSRALHLRDHRKLMVVDGRIGFVGGVNISPVYASGSSPLGALAGSGDAPDGDAKPGWRDTHVRVEGPIVAQLQRLFIAHWNRFSTCALRGSGYFPAVAPAGTQRVAVTACDAGRRRNPFYRALLAAINAARHRIYLTTAYLVPTRRLARALVRAARRGVDVQLLLPGLSDFWAPLQAGRSHYGRFLRAGIRLHELHDTLLHAKTCVIDGVWTSVGSSNLDWRSFLHNAEANLVVLDAGLGRAREIDRARWARRGLRQRLAEAIARRFEFFL
jgi:cardiolipin synthase